MKATIFVFLLILPVFIFGQQDQQNPQKIDKKITTQKVLVQKVKATEKKACVEQNYPTEAYLKANNVPDNFPRFKDTGNPKLDRTRYSDEKQAWIKKHPQEFEKIKHLTL